MAKNWSAMTVTQLKVELNKINLDKSGNKSDIVKRLEEHFKGKLQKRTMLHAYEYGFQSKKHNMYYAYIYIYII